VRTLKHTDHLNCPLTLVLVLKQTDEEFLELAREKNFMDGSTCVMGVVMNGKLTLANIGDSTALLIKNSNVVELTSEHNYSRLDEFKRINDQNL
jgi:serine/threonine protein phosphatase PrpC